MGDPGTGDNKFIEEFSGQRRMKSTIKLKSNVKKYEKVSRVYFFKSCSQNNLKFNYKKKTSTNHISEHQEGRNTLLQVLWYKPKMKN